jgi:hypothetical protein
MRKRGTSSARERRDAEPSARKRWGPVTEAMIRARMKARHRRPFRFDEEELAAARPVHQMLRRRLPSTEACPAKEQKGRVDREIAGSERSQTSEGRNPMDVARMKQAWQVRRQGAKRDRETWQQAETEQTLDVAPSREQGETGLARALNRTKTRRPKRPGNRSGRSLSLQNIEGAQNLRKACRALQSGAIRREGLRQPTPASGKVERKARRRLEHKGHWPCSKQIGFGKPRVPGVAAQVVEDGTTQWVPTFPVDVVRPAQPRSCKVKERRPAQAARSSEPRR